MPNYLNSKVYKLVSNLTSDIYIGSCVVELSKRLSLHKSSHNTCSSKNMFINDAIITIVLLEAYACTSKNELKARELYYITNNKCININKPFITDILYSDKEYGKEYYLNNADKIIFSSAKYYLDNTDKIKATKAQYRLDNVDKFKAIDAKYYLDNADKIKATKAKYYLDNVDKIKTNMAKYNLDNADKIKATKAKYYLEQKMKKQSI